LKNLMSVHTYPGVGWAERPFGNRIALYSGEYLTFLPLISRFENDEGGIRVEQAGFQCLRTYSCSGNNDADLLLTLGENGVPCAQWT